MVMGPSGSGKSTLLAVLSGLIRPDAGLVEVLGTHLWALSDRQREVFRRLYCGFIFQQYNLFPALTALQQLEISLEWASNCPARQAAGIAKETLISLGLQDKLNLRPRELSGGENQRVSVARALAKRPRLLFADEPTAALDWTHGARVIEMMQWAARQCQTTVLLVSHDPRILPMVDRVLHLVDGRLTVEQ